MLGAIVGDFIGSYWEGVEPFQFRGDLLSDKSHFTDDTVLTIATAYTWAIEGDLGTQYRDSIRDYQNLGFSEPMHQWAAGVEEQQQFNYGNGAAIRVSPVAIFAENLQEAIALSRSAASITHPNEMAVRQAEVIGGATFLAHRNFTPTEIRQFALGHYPSLFQLRRSGIPFQWESIVTAIEVACDTAGLEECMRECISAGGDVDSVCAMAGAISEGLWGCPPQLLTHVLEELRCCHPDLFRMLRIALLGGAGPKHSSSDSRWASLYG